MLLLLMHVIWLNLKKIMTRCHWTPQCVQGRATAGGPGEQPPLQLMDLSNLQSTHKIFFSVHSIPTCGEYSFFLVFCINFLKYIFTITYSFTIQFRYWDDELLLCQEVVVENMDEWYKNCRYGIWLSMRQRPTK